MTTKQAADIIRMLLGYLKGEIEPPKQETIEEARAFEQDGYECLEMAIKALEQEPCEDCISRQEAINCVTLNEFRYKIVEDMKTLPSVTPKEKTGHWKPIEYDGYADGYPVWDVWECSQCGLEHNGDKESLTAFCPDCGCHMIEPQESEDKD